MLLLKGLRAHPPNGGLIGSGFRDWHKNIYAVPHETVFL
jgi:hypothetical protein